VTPKQSQLLIDENLMSDGVVVFAMQSEKALSFSFFFIFSAHPKQEYLDFAGREKETRKLRGGRIRNTLPQALPLMLGSFGQILPAQKISL
jgi:hypothetical protein